MGAVSTGKLHADTGERGGGRHGGRAGTLCGRFVPLRLATRNPHAVNCASCWASWKLPGYYRRHLRPLDGPSGFVTLPTLDDDTSEAARAPREEAYRLAMVAVGYVWCHDRGWRAPADRCGSCAACSPPGVGP